MGTWAPFKLVMDRYTGLVPMEGCAYSQRNYV
jgi:hypothetical protein